MSQYYLKKIQLNSTQLNSRHRSKIAITKYYTMMTYLRKRKRHKTEKVRLERSSLIISKKRKITRKMPPSLDVNVFQFDCTEDSSNEGCGSINLGNSCYMNAALQCMSTSKMFVSKLRRALIQKQDVVLKWNALQQQSYKQVMLVCQALILMNADEKIKLDLTRLKEILPLPYKSFTQEDPQEFLAMMFDVIQNVILDFDKTEDLYNHPFAATPMKNFLFPAIQQTTCDTCGHIEQRNTQEMFVSIPFVTKMDVQTLYTLRNESVKVDNVYCDNCSPEPITADERAQIRNKLKSDKRVVKTKEFKEPASNSVPVEFFFMTTCFKGLNDKKSGDIVLQQRSSFGDFQCKLVSVVLHAGKGSRVGHYLAFRLVGEQWMLCNDHLVLKVSFEEIKNQAMHANYTPYLLHYKRVDSQEGNEMLLQELEMAQRDLKSSRIEAMKVQDNNDRKLFSTLELSKRTTALQPGDISGEDGVEIIHVQEDITTAAEVDILPSQKDKNKEF